MTNLEKILQKYYKFFLILIFTTAVIVRCWYLPNKNINFGYDQARDAFAVQQIIHGHLKILGLPTSGVPGLFHGVLYYYVITPAYYFGHGNPLIVAYWLSFINALTIFPVFYLAYLLTKKKTPAIVAAIIFAISYDAIQFSNFIETVSLGILFIPIIYIGIILWVKKLSKFGPLITGIALGLAIQSDIAFYFYLIPVILWLSVYRNKITKKDVIMFALFFVLAISTMIVSEIKFSFTGLKALVYLFSSQDKIVQSKQFSDFLIIFLNQMGDRFASTIYPFNTAFGALVGFGMVAYSFIRKTADRGRDLLSWPVFLITYIPLHILVLPFGGSITPYIMIGAIPAIAVLVAIVLWQVLEQSKFLLVLVVTGLLLINLLSFVKQNKNAHQDYFVNDYMLSTELKVIDYTYQKAGQKPFSISSLTKPLFINTLWSYLYNWYGMSKYGYLPYWIGRDQVGQPGNNLQNAPKDVSEHFFIEEPVNGIPDQWVIYANGDQDSMSNLVDQKNFGQIVVQERIMKK